MPVLTKINTNSIAEDAITGDKFAGDAYLSNTANQNISGTYSENRLYTSDAYTLSGNTTVNSHLTLSSIKPTADVVLTAGGAYTLTGTGTLSAGALLAPATTDLTGMTGELGSVVTGSPNLNLTTTTTFPAGMTINTVGKMGKIWADEGCGSTTPITSAFFNIPIICRGTNSKFIIHVDSAKVAEQNNNAPGSVWLSRTINGSLTELVDGTGVADRYLINHPDNQSNNRSFVFWDEPLQTAETTITYAVRFVRNAGSGDTFYFVSAYAMGTMTIQEIST